MLRAWSPIRSNERSTQSHITLMTREYGGVFNHIGHQVRVAEFIHGQYPHPPSPPFKA